MKIKAKLLSRVSIAAAVMFAVGCNTVSVSSQQSIAAPSFPTTDPASVQILQTPPMGAHVRLGEITLQPSGNPTKEMIQTKLRAAAGAWARTRW